MSNSTIRSVTAWTLLIAGSLATGFVSMCVLLELSILCAELTEGTEGTEESED